MQPQKIYNPHAPRQSRQFIHLSVALSSSKNIITHWLTQTYTPASIRLPGTAISIDSLGPSEPAGHLQDPSGLSRPASHLLANLAGRLEMDLRQATRGITVFYVCPLLMVSHPCDYVCYYVRVYSQKSRSSYASLLSPRLLVEGQQGMPYVEPGQDFQSNSTICA